MSSNIILDAAEQSIVVLHYHLMKNAGTTVAAILEREFGDAFSEVHRPDSNGRIDAGDIVALVRRMPRLRALSSHHFTFPVPKLSGVTFVDICPVRHPIDRLESLYTYLRVSPQGDELSALAAAYDAGAFLRIALDRYPNYTHSVQTVALGNENEFRLVDDAALARAVATVRNTFVPAVVERLDESLCAAEYYLRPLLPNLHLHYVVLNNSRDPYQPLRDKLADLENRCSAMLMEELRTANRADLALYDAANEELDRRIAAIPAFEARLVKFRERCAEAAEEAAAAAEAEAVASQ
jgi:hypothetical protein